MKPRSQEMLAEIWIQGHAQAEMKHLLGSKRVSSRECWVARTLKTWLFTQVEMWTVFQRWRPHL